MDVKETVKKIKTKLQETETVAQITNKIKSSGAVDAVVNLFKNDDYLDAKKEILQKIKQYDKIIIYRHVHPDGDALGSAYGLRDILRASFPNKQIYAVGKDNVDYLTFLGQDDVVPESVYKGALAIVVDTSTKSRISGDYLDEVAEVIKMDHHIETDPFGKINYVRENLPSTATIITDFFDTFKNELKMTSEGAKALYLGTVTDTGRFRYASVTGDTLRLAGSLLDYKFDTEKMYAYLNIKDKESLKLLGYVYNHFKVSPNGVAYIYLNKRIQKRFKVTADDAAALVNSLDSIKGSMIWILFVDFDDTIRARLRSRYTSVVDIASQFNGGGHAQASGAVAKNKADIKKMIKIADEKLAQFKKENGDLF
jgi:phosphoesterase RecJ-like protein